MFKEIFVLALFSLFLIPAKSSYSMVWSDEFDGSSLDSGAWNVEQRDTVQNNELEAYTNGNVYVSDGLLHMVAKKQNWGNKHYTSGRINSRSKKTFLYGKFEARMKMPAGKGFWPAFWLLPNDFNDWPAHGEIDIMEVLGHDLHTLHGTVHMGTPGHDINGGAGFGGKTSMPDPYNEDFHLYTVEWTPGQITWSVDENVYFTAKPSQTKPYWPFVGNKFYIIFNLAVGGNWPGAPDSHTVFPNEFVVDYVRVYQNNALELWRRRLGSK
jgi:beta-glucanase (GH16 family)